VTLIFFRVAKPNAGHRINLFVCVVDDV
jgi:hypothetical protein